MSTVAKKQLKTTTRSEQMSSLPKRRLDPGQATAFRHWALKALARARWGFRLPDDQHGRSMLEALLVTGMTGPEAQQRCPWLSPGELQELIQWADCEDPATWNGERLGDLVELTNEEREALELWLLRPCDVDWSVVQEWRRALNKERRQQQKELIKMARNEPMRDESLLFLIDKKWEYAARLPDKVEGGVAWRNKRNGSPITGKSLKVLVHQALDSLQSRGLIESQELRGLRFIRRKNQGKLSFYSVKSHVHAKSADEMGTSDSVA